VLEGGNLLLDDHPPALTAGDLSLLTTHHDTAARNFSTFEATSAATALAARMSARLWSAHPSLWAETVRALLVSSARWTPAMLSHLPHNPTKGDYDRLFRRYGFGVPDLRRAGRSATDMVTLIIEDEITPYIHSDTVGAEAVHNEIKLHRLPWPENALRRLSSRPVTLRVALSTFVEPNPAEAARGRKLRYGSHGLRFKLRRADETSRQFRVRINRAAASEDGRARVAGTFDEDGWTFGTRRRDVGSLHIDELTCPASDLARRDFLAVHPVGGWWKTRLRPGQKVPRARYALVIEIDAEDGGANLYTEVELAIAAMVAVQT
jgi:Subtilase family